MTEFSSEELVLSVLVTREEYSEGAAQPVDGATRVLVTLAGAVLCALGLAGLIFGRAISLASPVALLILLGGALCLAYPYVIAPVLHRAAAARDFDACESYRLATQYRIGHDHIVLSNTRVQGTLPLDAVTQWRQTSELFVLDVGQELRLVLPKRLLNEEESRRLTGWLDNRRGDA